MGWAWLGGVRLSVARRGGIQWGKVLARCGRVGFGAIMLSIREWTKRLYGEQWRELRREVLERDGHECVFCGCPVLESTSHIHHRLPLSEGGTNHIDNLESRCPKHHEDRHPHMKYTKAISEGKRQGG